MRDDAHRRLQFHAGEVCVSYLVMVLFSAILLKYTAFVHHQLATGDLSFTPKAILPTFRALLWTLASAAVVLIGLNLVLICVFSNDSLAIDVYVGLLYAGRHFVLALAPAFLYQSSLSRAALARASAWALLLAGGALVLFLVPRVPTSLELYASLSLLLVFFVAMAWSPPSRASVPVIRRYAAFALVHVGLAAAHVACVTRDLVETGSPFSSLSSVWLSMTPLFVWHLLTSDTQYWRGQGAKSLALQHYLPTRTHVPERVSAEGLHVLIEMHRQHVIDFAALDVRQRIGAGANAIVFSGLLRAKVPVSIKAYTPADLSDLVLAEFSQEAALCANLAHPNVVRFYGLSVCPPTVSLVFELCRGSLRDLARSSARSDDYGCRALLQITHMLDAARAVAYLHSFSPPFIHRELSLASFLVDVHGVVKLAGFGDSRVLNQFRAPTARDSRSKRPRLLCPGFLRARSRMATAWEERSAATSPNEPFEYAASDAAAAVRKVPFHAPFSERVDVYALGMAFWELLHPAIELPGPSDRVTCHDAEWRPLFHDAVPADVRELIESTWARDPRARPTAAQLAHRLEAIQQAALHENLDCVASAVDPTHWSLADATAAASQAEMVDGADAVRNLVSSNQVQHSWEAVRLGNAWMEAGLLHEERHAAPFQNKPNMRYYFAPAPASRTTDSAASGDDSDDGHDVLVIGMSMSTRASYSSKFLGVAGGRRERRHPKRCTCRANARQVAPARRPWRTLGTAESRALAQHDFTMSSSYETLLTSVLFVTHEDEREGCEGREAA